MSTMKQAKRDKRVHFLRGRACWWDYACGSDKLYRPMTNVWELVTCPYCLGRRPYLSDAERLEKWNNEVAKEAVES